MNRQLQSCPHVGARLGQATHGGNRNLEDRASIGGADVKYANSAGLNQGAVAAASVRLPYYVRCADAVNTNS